MSSPSLLSFLDAPVVVGDPDGRAAYVNPAFETSFSVSAEHVTGQPLANLFEGGVREAVLSSVAEVCSSGTSGRFRVKHGSVGYAGLASPIVAADARVGVLIVFSESAPDDERVHKLQRKVVGPIEEVARIFEELSGAPAVQGDEKLESLVTNGTRSADQLRGFVQELSETLSGRRPERASRAAPAKAKGFEPASLVSKVAGALMEAYGAADVALEVRVPAELPRVAGDPDRFRVGLDALLMKRLEVAAPGSKLALAGRTVERDGDAWVVIAIMDVRPGGGAVDDDDGLPEALAAALADAGAEARVTTDPTTGRTTAIRLTAIK